MEISEEQLENIKEKSYIDGQKSLLISQLGDVLRHLGLYQDVGREYLISEREATALALRQLVRDLGEEDDFENDLYVPDIINKWVSRNIDFDDKE